MANCSAHEISPGAILARSVAVVIASVVLGAVGQRLPVIAGLPPIWFSSDPPEHLWYCGRSYRDPTRTPDRPESAHDVIEATDGWLLPFPSKQTVVAHGGDEVCTTVLYVHDSRGWVAYSLVGGP
jgi:hypothetical protein